MKTQRRVTSGYRARRAVAIGGSALALALASVPAANASAPAALPAGTPTATRVAAPQGPADLDVMFIGAHPDDEASRLSVYGQWGADYGVRTGVITVTRGEGGGNAVGPEEGPALGLIREAEERRAVARAGITDIYNLDDVDFYYTVSEPLTSEVWSSETLEKVIRVIRQTKPEVLFTMDPAPSPGNHGNHQEAALLALMAYTYAGDPTVFPDQITSEGLAPWAPSKIFGGARGSGTAGAACPTNYTPVRPTQDIYGVWGGTSAPDGRTWAQIEREAQREYVSQGWAAMGPAAANPTCDYFTQFASRVPFIRGDQSAATADPATALRGALLVDPDGLPFGTGLEMHTDAFTVGPGATVTAQITVTAPTDRALQGVNIAFTAPDWWHVDTANLAVGDVPAGESRTVSAQAQVGPGPFESTRVLLEATATDADGKTGYTDVEVNAVDQVQATQQLLPQVRTFQEWATAAGFPQMEGFVRPVLTMPLGGSRQVGIDVHNYSTSTWDGMVYLSLPAGFETETPELPYANLAPGASTTLTFTVRQTDPAMATSMDGGDYAYDITTTFGANDPTTSKGYLELVPAASVPASAAAPQLDGVISPGEYTSQIDISRRWEGDACTDAGDCSGMAYLTRHGDDLYIATKVTDDVIGTRLDADDCKRHWRTDSIEIAIDPRGTSENTSGTFKALVLPVTAQGPGCFGRDADNHQGGPETAPGMQIATSVSDPFTGYVVETKIPASILPDTIDPAHVGLNVFFYDSDTQDRTGQTRLGWSTWGGVQGDPYRWGVVDFPGWVPPTVAPATPVIPSVALSSLDSPQTIDQAVRTGVAVSGKRAADAASTASVVKAWASGARTTVLLNVTGPATTHIFVLDADDKVIGSLVAPQTVGAAPVEIPVTGTPVRVLVAAAADSGGSTSSGVALTGEPASTTQVTIEPSRPVAGRPVTTVVAVDGAGLAVTGEVSVEVDGAAVGTSALVDGGARVDLGTGLSVGEHTVRAVYPGAGLLPGSSGEVRFTVTVSGDGRPVAPVDTLTDANRGEVTVPASAAPGETITVKVSAQRAGTSLDSWLFSTPTWLGSRVVSETGSFRVTIPADATLGTHRLAVYDGAGTLIGWGPIEVRTATSGGSGLPVTGAQIAGIAVAALVLIGAGTAVVMRRRRRVAA